MHFTLFLFALQSQKILLKQALIIFFEICGEWSSLFPQYNKAAEIWLTNDTIFESNEIAITYFLKEDHISDIKCPSHLDKIWQN